MTPVDTTEFCDSSLKISADLDSAPVLGDYKLIAKIGQGGIAEIYKAIQQKLNREVAVKILFPRLSRDPEIVRRFDQESMTIAHLNHPNIVSVIDRGFAEGRYYFVMEYVEGAVFKDVIKNPDTPLNVRLEIIVMTLKGLDYAHKNGVIHRDVKPANILIDMHGNAKVADFGIAQILEKPEADMTSSSIVMGTMAYMSPEQKTCSANVDCTTDIYAVGVMLYETLLGEKPLGNFKMPSEINPKIPKGFDKLIERCLAPRPADRYQSAVALKDDLLELISSDSHKDNTSLGSVTGIERIVGRCRFLDTIKENTHGSTYLVENTETKKLLVIKRHNGRGKGLEAAKALAKVSHENLVSILGSGSDGDKTVIVMEYAPGGSLVDRLARAYDWKQTFELGAQIARGLAQAHQRNIIHGNLRPSNILFDESDTPKISDFGMPVHYSSRRNWYSPPEKSVTAQADIFSLGVILYQMLFGKTPTYDRFGDLVVGEISNKTPARVIEILLKLLATQPAARYQSCDEFLADWQDFIAEDSAPSPELAPSLAKKNKALAKHSGLWMLTVGVAIGMVMGVAISYLAGLPG